MYTRSRLVGPGSGTSSISRNQAGDGQRSDLGLKQHRRQSLEVAAPKDSTMERQGHAEQSSAGAYTVITPNESRRQKFLRVAEQELADLKRWKEQNRAKLVHLVPQRLGGSQSESEVRQKQQLQQMRSKYQQKLKREESIRIRKEAEEAELQKMKAIQREKSNKLEEKKQLQENIRRDTFREHHQSKTAEFLSRLDTERNRSACQIRPHAAQSSTWNKLLETKGQHQEEERAQIHQAEHRRVNNAFLDRLQGKSQPGGLEQSGGCWTMNSTNSWGI
ncbi:epithelial-stromal interaction protein 1 isoform X3 [Meriones unguiculatus]|uniref:epithelial-stromal interaction protein 1 isoform X3 n=1 Tax=Meriones unguiculatus TaxID=10047 RepID=UPI00293EC1DA|nr:epithelial-stromal interaction protein 1 isoform X3 [Meriones unguiculatus]